MSKVRYFILDEDSESHIGTVKANDNQQLQTLVSEACRSHFDADVVVPELDVEDYIFGRGGNVTITVNDTEERKISISIRETWLYE